MSPSGLPGKDAFTSIHYHFMNEGRGCLIHGQDPLNLTNRMCEIMQFTGLKDRQGKEIYEGDIVDWTYDCCEGACICPNRDSGRVVIEITTDGFFFTSPYHTLTIIGNKFENPELLEAKP